MGGAIGWGLVVLAVGLAPVPAEPAPDPLSLGYLGVRVDGSDSLRISGIDPGTPAAKAGLLPNDEFVRVGDLKPASFAEVAEHIKARRPGTVLTVEVRRGDETKRFAVRLGVRPSENQLQDRLRNLGDPIP